MKRTGGRRIVASIAVLVATVAVGSSLGPSRPARAGAAAVPTALSCSATSTLGTAATSPSLDLAVTGAPAQSLPSKTFTLAITDPGETLPATLQGDPVTSERGVTLSYPVPAGATFVSASLSGGVDVGTGATVAEVADALSPDGEDVVETVPGPIPAGQSFSLPTLDLTLTASATVGTLISTALLDVPPAGSSTVSADPALTATLQVSPSGAGPVAVTESCWPTAPVPTALSGTTVVSVDTTPPAITVTTPVSGAIYALGQAVDADYTCSDVASYGVATCAGPVTDGAAIDTSSAGVHTFTVDATDTNGTPAQQTVSYLVQAAADADVIGPADAGTVTLAGGTSCSFGGTGCPVVTAPEATYQVTAPVPNGGSLVIGDVFDVQWQLFEPGGSSSTGAGGPELSWTLPAPTGGVIDGPVTTSSTGLVSPGAGPGSALAAGACTDGTCSSRTTAPGIVTVNGEAEQGTGWTYDAVDQPSLSMSWDEDSAPTAGTDGLYLDVTYPVKVTAPGTVTLPGFPSLTGPAGLATSAVATPDPPVSFTVTDPIPPSAAIASPLDGAVFTFGQAVDTAYSCADPLVAVTSCTGPVADGSPLDTTSAAPGGVHTFTVTATDSAGNTATSSATYTVQATPPVAAPASYSVAWGASADLPVLSADTATDYPIDPGSVTVVTAPADGAATVNPDGSVTYVDNPALSLANVEKTGSLDDSFTYKVSDTAGDVSNITTVTVTLEPPLVVSSISPVAADGLTLGQSQAQPTDPMASGVDPFCGTSVLLLSGEAQDSCGELSPVTITDDGGGASGGWSLTGQVSDFVDPSAPPSTTCDTPASYSDLCIPGGDLGWSPSATVDSVLPGSAAAVQPGPAVDPAPLTVEPVSLPGAEDPMAWALWPADSAPGSSLAPPAGLHDLPRLLCRATSGASGGSFTCGAGLTLPVPASSAASSGSGYRATITLTLS